MNTINYIKNFEKSEQNNKISIRDAKKINKYLLEHYQE